MRLLFYFFNNKICVFQHLRFYFLHQLVFIRVLETCQASFW